MTTVTSVDVDNPYVGPRAFQPGEPLHGRDDELTRLLDLLIAERIVLVYSPSGAGKTSLLQAGLITGLRDEGFLVLPVIRVGLEASPGQGMGSTNRYMQSMLSCLEEGRPGVQRLPKTDSSPATFDEYLDRWPGRGDSDNVVLIFDQFEELLILDPTDRPAKEEFLAQVGDVMRDGRHWTIFAMREEFIAGLDPYLHLIPTRLATTFRLDFLDEEAARLAIQNPARESRRHVVFSDAATTKLIDDLRRVVVQRPEGPVEELGPYIEPLQLQVVCRRLWERLPEDATTIDEEADVEAVKSVDDALRDYYDERVKAIAAETGVSRRWIRDWFETELITEEGFRGQVLGGPKATGEAGKQVLSLLQDARLVRGEKRKGAIWYELAHDRLIAPVRASNADWRERNLSILERQAPVWDTAGRPDDLLLTHEVLVEAEKWAAQQPSPLRKIELEFLGACRRLRSEMQRARRRRLLLVLTAGLAGLVTVASGLIALIDKDQELDDKAQALDHTNQALTVKNEELNTITSERNKAAWDLYRITSGRSALDAITEAPEVQALDPRGQDVDRPCSDGLAIRLERHPRFQDFGVVNARGEVRCIALYEKVSADNRNFANRIWFIEAVTHPGDDRVGEFQVGRITQCPTVTFARRIAGREPGLVAFASLHLSWLPRSEPAASADRCDGR